MWRAWRAGRVSHGPLALNPRAEAKLGRPTRPEQAAAALQTATAKARDGTGRLPRLAVASAADPVDRATGRLIHPPDAPFLLGELDPAEVLAPYVDGPVIVDNDVNWAARAEREILGTTAPDEFAYIFLGEGLGAAVVSDGGVTRGHHGLAGEIAHLVTAGPYGQAMPSSRRPGPLMHGCRRWAGSVSSRRIARCGVKRLAGTRR